jgi:polar amino acid transport system substrate-binding protein
MPLRRPTPIVLFGALLLALSSPSLAAAPEATSGPARRLRVSTRVLPPFVVEEKDELTGFSIELWRSIATRLGLEADLFVTGSVTDLLATVRTGKADLAVAAISITSEREKTFDFSQPIFESGLQILAPRRSAGSGPSPLASLFSPALLQLLGLMLLLVLIPAHIVWLVERRHEEGIIGTERYVPGIFSACWWAVSTLATQAESMPRTTLGKIVAVVWMFAGVLFVAYFTATVTSSLTVQRLQGSIRGPRDLPGKRVATTAGSTSAAYLKQQGIETLLFNEIDGAYRALLAERADAVVYDSPILLHYAANEGKGKVEVVGGVFRQESYGILLPRHSPHRKPINEALLRLREDGTYQQIYERWFGAR